MATKVKMANPGPSTLMIVNPSKGKKMRKRTTRKRRSSAARRRNPSPTRTHHRKPVVRRRRRNPSFSTGLVAEGILLAGGGALTQFTTGLVPPIGGASALADAARTAAVAYILGVAASKFGFGRYSRAITLGGMAVAGGKLIQSFLYPFASRVFAPRSAETAPSNGQVQGIGMYRRGMNPYGLRGIALQIPGQFPFSSYAPEFSPETA